MRCLYEFLIGWIFQNVKIHFILKIQKCIIYVNMYFHICYCFLIHLNEEIVAYTL